MAVSDVAVAEIAAVINTTPPDEMALMNWIGAMRSGDYKFGYGLMRSGEDEYDAFGVLAAISVVDWTWDAHEGAWAVDGEVYGPTTDMLAGWLGIPTTREVKEAGVPKFLTLLIDRINAVGDGAADFKPLADLLDKARIDAKAAKDRFNGARGSIQGRKTIGGHMGYDSHSDIRPYFARY